ncbi:MAG TPA: hypothetical protein VNQ33_08465 [Acidimicrobiales bacterium]|nr:hypothetical protein [Acidimicrobiales bacterium]
MTTDLVARVFHLRCEIIEDPTSGTPLILPISALERRAAPASASSDRSSP